MKSLAYVGIGSNLAHPRRRIARALIDAAKLPRSRLVAASPNYVSAPVDASGPQPDYVNAVFALRTALSPANLLRNLRIIESRQVVHRWSIAAATPHGHSTWICYYLIDAVRGSRA